MLETPPVFPESFSAFPCRWVFLGVGFCTLMSAGFFYSLSLYCASVASPANETRVGFKARSMANAEARAYIVVQELCTRDSEAEPVVRKKPSLGVKPPESESFLAPRRPKER